MGKYIYSFRISFMKSLEYRSDYFFTITYALFPIVMQLFIWLNIFSGKDSLVFGYTFTQLICYTVLSNFINSALNTGIHFKVNSDVKDGSLNSFIVKPANYIIYKTFGEFGGKATEFLIVSIMGLGAVVYLIFFSELVITFYNLLFFAISLFLAFFINFFIYLTFSFLSFWITEAGMIFATFQMTVVVISGGIFPLDIFGNTFMKISNYLPFQSIVYLPLNIIMGKFDMNEIGSNLLIQTAWLILFFTTSFLFWRKGIKKYIAIGG